MFSFWPLKSYVCLIDKYIHTLTLDVLRGMTVKHPRTSTTLHPPTLLLLVQHRPCFTLGAAMLPGRYQFTHLSGNRFLERF